MLISGCFALGIPVGALQDSPAIFFLMSFFYFFTGFSRQTVGRPFARIDTTPLQSVRDELCSASGNSARA